MLVPLVLRNIVLPYLRAGTGAAGVTVTAIAVDRGRRISASAATKARAEAALLAERDEVRWETFARARALPVPPPLIVDAAQPSKPPNTKGIDEGEGEGEGEGEHERGIPNPKRRPKHESEERAESGEREDEGRGGKKGDEDDGYISKGKKGKSRPPRRAKLDEPELHSDKPPRTLRVMALNVASLHAGRRADALPLALQKLFQARLLRPGISMLLDHPEWWQDVRLIAAVIAELEDNGARPLAQRVRRTLEMGVAIGPGGRVRLWSDPKPKPASKVIKVDSASLHVEVQAAPLPPALKQLFHARLFRAAVFTLLDNPGWWEDEALMATVITKLEDNGAPSLAYRVRRTLERGVVVGAGGRVRLWSDPKRKAASEGEAKVEAESESKAEPTAEFETASQSRPKSRGASNRVPLVPRIAYPETTEQARRTHHWNLLLTQWLTVQHPIPYASPFERARPNGHTAAPARLRRLRDVLHTIDKLRRTRDFVPDRVTANIVLKAYLSDLARNTHGMGRDARPIPNRAGVRAEDVLEMFKVIAVSMEDDVDRGLVFPGSETGEIRRSEQKRREKGSGPVSPLDFDGLERFDPHVSYEKHVLPFTRMIGRALARVGSHRGRVIVEKWGKDMRARILKLQSEAESGKGTVEDKSK